MDRSQLEQTLEEAERHVTEGQQQIDELCKKIAELKGDGHDVTQAMELLIVLETTEQALVERRDRLLAEITAVHSRAEQ